MTRVLKLKLKILGALLTSLLLMSGCTVKDLDKISDEDKIEDVISYLEDKEEEGLFNGVGLYKVFNKKDETELKSLLYTLEDSIFLDYMYAMSSGYLDVHEYADTFTELNYEIKTVSASIQVFWDIENYEREAEVTNRSRQYLYGTVLVKTAEKYLEEFKGKESKTETERTLRESLASEYEVAILEGYNYLEELNSKETKRNSLVTTTNGQMQARGIYFDFIQNSVQTLEVLNNIALNDLAMNEEELVLKQSKNIDTDSTQSSYDVASTYNLVHTYLEENLDLSTDIQVGRETILMNIYKLYREYDDSWYTMYNQQYGENEQKLMGLLVNVDKSETTVEAKQKTKSLIVKYYTSNVNLSKEVKELVRITLEGGTDYVRIQKIYLLNMENNKMGTELSIIKKSLVEE